MAFALITFGACDANLSHLGVMANAVCREFTLLPKKDIKGKSDHGNAQ
jgi:hypothetical protein